MSTLGIDLGTTGVRAVAYDASGVELASVSAPTSVTRSSSERVETDAEAVLAATEDVIRAVVAHSGVRADPVAALAFSTQGEAVVPVDREGRALAPAPVSMDGRGASVAAAVGDLLGEGRVQELSGQPLHPMFSVYKIAAGGPGWTDAAEFRCLDSFIAARLGAAPVTDFSMAARTGAFDVAASQWSDELMEAASASGSVRVDRTMLPTAVPAGTTIGAVDAAAAARTGLEAGTTIVAGAHDQAASWIGAGGHPGTVSVFALGSSDCLTVGSPGRPGGLVGTGFATYPLRDGVWITLAGTAAGGWALEWFSAIVGTGVAELFEAPAEDPPALLVLPYLTGSGTLDNDTAATGAIVGLTLGTSRSQLARAFLEAGGFELAKILEALAERGIAVGDVQAVGSGSANAPGLRVRAHAAGTSLTPVDGYPSARGAAMLAALGAGHIRSLDDVPSISPGVPARPDPMLREWYDTQRSAYRALYPATRGLIHAPANHHPAHEEQSS